MLNYLFSFRNRKINPIKNIFFPIIVPAIMRMKKIFILMTVVLITSTIRSYSATDRNTSSEQSPVILKILKNEKNNLRQARLTEIVNKIDQTYGNLYESLSRGNRLVIFFDPAHGKLPNGQWQGGEATRRNSCTNLPEEFYSIRISRKMFELLRANKFIEVKTTDDFLAVLKGESDTYMDIPFTKTVELADKYGAFIIIAEHLNNISAVYKADGTVNLPGIHVTRNGFGWKVLQFVRDTYSGFLTLYNKLDASGFSLNYALNLKKTLMAQGLKPNSWNFGAVGDTRFCYFVDFPVSIIYESGFISNPVEEKNLRDTEYINKIVRAQYSSFLDTIRETFSVDISGETAKKIGTPSAERIELLKLARMAIYYIKNSDINKGIQVIAEMEKKYSKTKYREFTAYFSTIKNCLALSSRYYDLAKKYRRQNKLRLARNYFRQARRQIHYAPIFTALHERYRKELRGGVTAASANKIQILPIKKSTAPIEITRATPGRSVIFPIEQNQELEKAIELALSPDADTMKKLVSSFINARILKKIKVTEYSRAKKRWITSVKKVHEKVKFSTGIYIVRLDNKLNVISAQYVNSVTLNPAQYQNQQYLKNSYFAHGSKERSL